MRLENLIDHHELGLNETSDKAGVLSKRIIEDLLSTISKLNSKFF